MESSPLDGLRCWNDAPGTAAAYVSIAGRSWGWFRTADRAELGADGHIYIRDRLKDIIIVGGENVCCAEVRSFSRVDSVKMQGMLLVINYSGWPAIRAAGCPDH